MFYVIVTTGKHDYYGPKVNAYGPFENIEEAEARAAKSAHADEVVITKAV